MYNTYGRQKWGDDMSSKMGRPTDNPKNHKITVRLDEKSANILQRYCEQEQVEKGETVRRGLKKLESDLK